MKQQKQTLRTIALVIAVTLITKVLGVVREALQARVFGTALAFDLYTISYNNTIYIFTTVAYAVCVAAVPIVSKKLESDREAAFRTAGNLICVSLVVSLVPVCAGCAVFERLRHKRSGSPHLSADLCTHAPADRTDLSACVRVPVHGALRTAGQSEFAI